MEQFLHTFVYCVITAIVAFGAGAVYGHTLAVLIADEFKKEMAAAVAEIKKIRGEIVKGRIGRGEGE
jgi:hypothetical protein